MNRFTARGLLQKIQNLAQEEKTSHRLLNFIGPIVHDKEEDEQSQHWQKVQLLRR